MKFSLITSFVLSIFLFLSCAKEQAPTVNNIPVRANSLPFGIELGWVEYYYNGEYQKREYGRVFNGVGGFAFICDSTLNPSLQEDIYILDIPLKEKTHTIKRNGQNNGTAYAFGSLALDNDGILNTWRPDTLHNNYIDINHVNPFAKQVAGTFQVQLLSETVPAPKNRPDTIKLTKGRFYFEYFE